MLPPPPIELKPEEGIEAGKEETASIDGGKDKSAAGEQMDRSWGLIQPSKLETNQNHQVVSNVNCWILDHEHAQHA